MNLSDASKYLTITAAAYHCGVSRSTVENRIRQGKLTAHSLGPHATVVSIAELARVFPQLADAA